jgi:dTDP-4-amino-4,6-dideoxygalactose transaminase
MYRATADVLAQLGYTLHFVDVDPHGWTLDPTALEAELAEGRVRVVVCVDTFGNPCDYGALRAVCRRAGVPLLADSAGALGSCADGIPVGTQADAHAFSMSFAKVVSAAGAGGAVVFPKDVLRRDCSIWLGSALMDELHAAAAVEQLELLEELVNRREQVANIYSSVVAELGDDRVLPQRVAPTGRHCYSNWVVRVPRRAAVADALARLGIETRAYFRALHLRADGPTPSLPVTEQLDRECLALPMSSELSEADAQAVALGLWEALGCSNQTRLSMTPASLAKDTVGAHASI